MTLEHRPEEGTNHPGQHPTMTANVRRLLLALTGAEGDTTLRLPQVVRVVEVTELDLLRNLPHRTTLRRHTSDEEVNLTIEFDPSGTGLGLQLTSDERH